MKKIFGQLFLIFSVFFLNINSVWALPKEIEEKVSIIVEKHFTSIEKKDWFIETAKKGILIIQKIEKIGNQENNADKLELLEYISHNIDFYLRKMRIRENYSYIEKWELVEAYDLKIPDNTWDEWYNRQEELENFKKIYEFWEEVEIKVVSINQWLEFNMFVKVEIKYLETWKLEEYNVLMNVVPANGMLWLKIRTVSVNNPDIKAFFE